MNILIPNSWLKDFLKTNATPQEFAKAMSLASVSIEKIEKTNDDYIYDIEVTTNRPDLMSVTGIAREASAVLSQAGYKAEFIKKDIKNTHKVVDKSHMLDIQNDSSLVNRILAVILEVELSESPEIIKKRLTATGIRSINSVVDVTNYIMRESGHPSHVFDYDRLENKKLIIRRSKKGEKIVTLDGKEYNLHGDDIVADDGTGAIVDLLGVMGTENSVVTPNTKRVVLFLDNLNEVLLRKTSMNLGIRSEAAILNEKGVDPELMLPTLLSGIELLQKNAKAKVISPIIDIYPNPPKKKALIVELSRINSLIGISIDKSTVTSIIQKLGFGVKNIGEKFEITVPSHRQNDISLTEDITEEVARIYGYHTIPNTLPTYTKQEFYHQDNDEFYWIKKIKDAFKLWGYNETYTYSMVGEELFDGPIQNAIRLKNPLTNDHEYLRNSLIPSLYQVKSQNKKHEESKLFEISNVYHKRVNDLPNEKLHLAVVLPKHVGFYDAKGVVEQVFVLLGIEKFSFEKNADVDGADVIFNKTKVGHIETIDCVALELDLSYILKSATNQRIYIEGAKFPPIVEDVRVEIPAHFSFDKIEKTIKSVSDIVEDVTLLDVYQNKKTFRITYRSRERNLTNEDILPIRKDIESILTSEFKALLG